MRLVWRFMMKLSFDLNNNKPHIMIRFFILVVLLQFSSTLVNASAADTSKHDIQAIEIQTTLPLFGEHYYRIFFKGNFVIYQSQYQYDSIRQKVKYDSAGNYL